MENFEIKREYAKQVNMIEFLKNRGYELDRKGKEYCLKEHHSVTINKHGWYAHKEGRGGNSAVSFLMWNEGLGYREAVLAISETMGQGKYEISEGQSKYTGANFNFKREPEQIQQDKPPFFLPMRNKDMRKVFAYLTKTRYLDSEILSELAHEKKLYESMEYFIGKKSINDKLVKILPIEQLKVYRESGMISKLTMSNSKANIPIYRSYDDEGSLKFYGLDDVERDVLKLQQSGVNIIAQNNCVFVGYDNEERPQYANMRGTNTYKAFKQDVLGSNKSYAWCMNENAFDTLNVFEAPIDAISYATMIKMGGGNWKSVAYIALGGLGDNALKAYLKEHSEVKNINFCVDNDEAGTQAYEGYVDRQGKRHPGFRERYEKAYHVDRIRPREKDFNQDLTNIMKAMAQEDTKSLEENEEAEI